MATNKAYTVRFANSNVGKKLEDNRQLRDILDYLINDRGVKDAVGHHLPPVELEGDHFQVRNLLKVGQCWRGCFARLRDEAPHVIDAQNKEKQLNLQVGDRILEKTYFLYYEDSDILVFQMSRNVGYLTKFAHYWSSLFAHEYVDFPPAVDRNQLQHVLNSEIRYVEFTYACPPVGDSRSGPKWTQRAIDMLRPIHGAVGKFTMRAPKNSVLGGHIKELIKWMANRGEVERAKVLLQDEKDPIDLFIDPIKVKITVPLHANYPDEKAVIEELAEAYSDQHSRLPIRSRT
jgi:hypothetical protein